MRPKAQCRRTVAGRCNQIASAADVIYFQETRIAAKFLIFPFRHRLSNSVRQPRPCDRRVLHPGGRFVNRTERQRVGGLRRKQQIVNPHAVIGIQRIAGIIPESVADFMRVKRTKSVKPALIQQGAEAFAGLRFSQRVGTEKFRIVNIGVSKNNIEIAAENHRPAATEKLPRMPKKSVHPAQLIFKLRNIVRRIVGRVAVRQINRGDANRAFAGFDVGFPDNGRFRL